MSFEAFNGASSNQEHREQEGRIIRLPRDPAIQGMLRSKLVEYEQRVSALKRGTDAEIDARYKRRLLVRLIENELVSVEEMRQECVEDFGTGFREDLFENAAGVIEQYCLGAHERRQVPQLIALADEEEIHSFLRGKLLEYESRLDPHLAPEEQSADALYKHSILSELLGVGHVDLKMLYGNLRSRFAERFDKDAFINAALVIDRYNKNNVRDLTQAAS